MTSGDLAAGARELLRVAESEQARLNQLDAVAGDGDHGATVVMGLRAVVASLPDDPAMPAAELLRLAAERFASVGGSTGPLWGTALLRAAQSLASSQSTRPCGARRRSRGGRFGHRVARPLRGGRQDPARRDGPGGQGAACRCRRTGLAPARPPRARGTPLPRASRQRGS